MKFLVDKLKPIGGFSQVAHLLLAALLPILVYILVTIDLPQAALAIILVSKWRMLAVKFRFWLAHIRTNAVDLTVSISVLIFMTESNSQLAVLIWTILFMIWLIFIKPATHTLMVTFQALIGFSLGMVSLFLLGGTWPLFGLVLATGLICYGAAHHFFGAFEEKYTRLFSYIWAWFGASVVWVLGHWLLFYGAGIIAQPALLLIAIGYGLSALYYLDHKDRLTLFISRQFVFIMVAITAIILTFSDWGDKIV